MRKRAAQKKAAQQKRVVTVGKSKTGKTAQQKRQIESAKKNNPRAKIKTLDTKEKRLVPYTNQYGSRS